MDVRCSRCGTEYDFDDALVSERGTTVKCTNCGHQFKVYSGAAGGAAPERWVVRKSSGRELVYTSLRDLQRAIAQKQVGPSDQLSRDGHPPRALHTIAELDPFFQAQGRGRTSGPPPAPVQRTLMGMSPSSTAVPGEDTQPDYSPFADQPAQPAARANPAATPAGGFRRTTPPPPPPRPVPVGGAKYGTPEDEPKTVRRHAPPEPTAEAPRTLGSTLMSSSTPAGVAPAPIPSPVIHAPVANDGVSGAFRAYQDSFSDESIPSLQPRRGAGLKWIVGLVVLGGLAFVAGTVGVRYAKKMNPAPVASAPPAADDRVDKLLAEGNSDLSHGDFESAKEQFDKASALAEQNPAVLSALARLEASRADVHWLTLKLLDPSQKAAADAAKAELDQRLVRVRKSAEAATRVAPTTPAVVRAQIDAYRLDGNVAKGRELVSSLGTDSSDPETAYVLAALDLADANPPWPTVIDRLRTAASDERGPGRAGAALVYALASSGAIDDANAALAKLGGGGVPPALVDRLKEFVNHAAPPGSASASASAAPSAAAAPVPPASATAAAAPIAANPGAAEPVPRAVDFRRLLEDASSAKRSGDFGRAESLYQAAHDQEPGNVEAIAGLGDVARMRGDTSMATTYYDTVLAQNPTYLPTLIASADMKWAAGNRAGAIALYKRVANQADPGTPYGQHAAQRIAEAQSSGGSGSSGSSSSTTGTSGAGGGAGGAPAPTTTASSKPAEPPSDLPTPPSDTPKIDTSDLPGFK